MGVKWTARLKVDFEMEDGAPANLAETYSKSCGGRISALHCSVIRTAGKRKRHRTCGHIHLA